MRISKEFSKFDKAMDTILRADPAKVKAAVDAEIEANAAERSARGEGKRGRKPKSQQSTSDAAPVSGAES